MGITRSWSHTFCKIWPSNPFSNTYQSTSWWVTTESGVLGPKALSSLSHQNMTHSAQLLWKDAFAASPLHFYLLNIIEVKQNKTNPKPNKTKTHQNKQTKQNQNNTTQPTKQTRKPITLPKKEFLQNLLFRSAPAIQFPEHLCLRNWQCTKGQITCSLKG